MRNSGVSPSPTICSHNTIRFLLSYFHDTYCLLFRLDSTPLVTEGAVPEKKVPGQGYFYNASDVSFETPVNFPPHQRCVEVTIDLGFHDSNVANATILGADLTHEYVTENADYRS